MKKVMIALATIVAAVSLQAAQAKWSANNLYIPGTTDKAAGYIAYFIETSAGLSADAALDLCKSGDLSTLSTYFTEGSVATSNSTGVFSSGLFGDYANSTLVEGYAIVFNAGSINDATLAYATTVASKATGASGQAANIAIGNLGGTGSSSDSKLASNWAEIAPEPTSGLLMLLGMGALALRRRRA